MEAVMLGMFQRDRQDNDADDAGREFRLYIWEWMQGPF